MNRRIPFVALGFLIATAVLALVLTDAGESAQPPLQEIQDALDEDAALGRFSGRLGDFMVYRAVDGKGPAEAEVFGCPAEGGRTPPVTDEARLKEHELWSDALGPTGIGWSCEGEIILVNNEGLEGRPGATLLARGYMPSVPLPIVRDAPAERLQQIEVEGHPALLEQPKKGFPYASASVVVIERYPDASRPGIAVFVIEAPSEEEAVRLAEELIP
ncbi:MAG: hypothetical protein WEE64_02400 [Dehalococcoidia bacterium]